MKVIYGCKKVPVIYTAHHASHSFDIYDDRVALNLEQKLRFSDYGTDMTVPENGLVSIIAESSRALGDLNRDPDDPGRFQEYDYAKPIRNKIWKEHQELNKEEKDICQKSFYDPFHQEIEKQLAVREDITFVVAWDNTAHYTVGVDDNGESVMMKPFILSNRGLQGSAHAGPDDNTSCDPLFLEIFSEYLAKELSNRDLPNEIHLNLVMKGGYICRQYSSMRNESYLSSRDISAEIQSFQVEYDTLLTHDQNTLEPIPEKMKAIKESFSIALELAFAHYFDK